MASTSRPSDHLVWKTTTVSGRPSVYGVAGEGLPVLFLHGWGLGQHTYKRALKRLAPLCCPVFAPALPRVGGDAGLARSPPSVPRYAPWGGAVLRGGAG